MLSLIGVCANISVSSSSPISGIFLYISILDSKYILSIFLLRFTDKL